MKAPAWRLASLKHSGKLRPHRHTSYAGLLFVLMLTGVILSGYSVSVGAAGSGVTLSLAPTISGPLPNTEASPLLVSGTCPAGAYVTVRRNNLDAGVSVCRDDGTYAMKVALFVGTNRLSARARDLSGRQGPLSAEVSTDFGLVVPGAAPQLLLQSSGLIAAGQVGTLNRHAEISGGVAPYAVAWDWGDGNRDLSSQSLSGTITGRHTYAEAKDYAVVLSISDATGAQTSLPMVAVISTAGQGTASQSSLGMILLAAWPVYVAALILVIAFWLGDLREQATLRRRRRA